MKTRNQLISLGIDGFKADEIMLLQEKMMEHAVKFQFRKKDGTIREAVGTLKQEKMIQEDGTIWQPKGESKPEPVSIVRFFDVVNKGWRCFSCVDFIAMEG